MRADTKKQVELLPNWKKVLGLQGVLKQTLTASKKPHA